MADTKLVTGKVRFSYAHVFEPTAISEGQEKKYSVNVIIPKSDKKAIERIKAAIAAAAEEGKAKFGGKIPANYKQPLRDGDEDRPDDEVYENSMFFQANSNTKPGLVDAALDPILDKEEFYSGCYGRVSVRFYAFNTNGNKGVAVGLNNIQKLEDGERLSGGGSTAAEDFGEGADDLM